MTAETNWLEVATDICLGRKPMPGISDAERLENLRDELHYATSELFDALKARNEAQRNLDRLDAKVTALRKNYESLKTALEMMAAGASKEAL